MAGKGILDTFASHAFLRGLSDQFLMILASAARPFTAAPGDLLAREGAEAKSFYLIQAGQVAIEIHKPDQEPVRLQIVGPGDVVGWSWIVSPHRWQFDARATENVSGLAFDAEWLRNRCEQDHEFGYQMLKQLVTLIANRLVATRQQLLGSS
jgi:CRP-like cAMP-binding protein